MSEDEAPQVDDEPKTNDEAAVDSEDAGMADAVDDRAAELTGAGGAGSDEPISEINRPAVDAAAAHLDDTNLDADREMLKKIQKGM